MALLAALSPRVELTESVFTIGVRTGYDDVVPVFGNYVPVEARPAVVRAVPEQRRRRNGRPSDHAPLKAPG